MKIFKIAAVSLLFVGFTNIFAAPPDITDIPGEIIIQGGSFKTIKLDDYVTDDNTPDNQISWTTTGGTNISVSINPARNARITAASGFIGSEVITFIATDGDGESSSDATTFSVNLPLKISKQPANTSAKVGGSASFDVSPIDFVSTTLPFLKTVTRSPISKISSKRWEI